MQRRPFITSLAALGSTALLPRLASAAAVIGQPAPDFRLTDTTGQVVQTAIASPVAPEVDVAAERIVSIMRIVPPQRNGRPAVLRSQVRVRFSR